MTTPTARVVRRARKRYGLTVYSHKAWGSKHRAVYAWRRKNKPAVSPADTVVQHITVTRPSGDLKADARVVEQVGMARFRSGVSYNFVVDMATGEVAVGQPLDAKGTHTVNLKRIPGYSYDQNRVARAIAVVGMPGTPLSEKAEESIAGLLAAMMDEGAITETFDYDPHSKFAWKDCPCDPTRDKMRAIRARAVELRKSAPVDEKPEPVEKKKAEAPSRGRRVDDAVGHLEGALGTASRKGAKRRERLLKRALRHLKRIEAR